MFLWGLADHTSPLSWLPPPALRSFPRPSPLSRSIAPFMCLLHSVCVLSLSLYSSLCHLSRCSLCNLPCEGMHAAEARDLAACSLYASTCAKKRLYMVVRPCDPVTGACTNSSPVHARGRTG
eukprot:6191851-Pleurochrysis_carterae.AAC.7